MKANPEVTGVLNQALKHQLTAINQYFLHARMCRNWGLTELDTRAYSASINAMKHADRLMQRILFLEALPNLQDLGKLYIGEEAVETIRCDLELATGIRQGLVDGIAGLEAAQDYISRELLEAVLEDNEEHIDWLETQLDLVEKTGLQNYLQSMM